MNREYILSILYDLALTIGAEVKVDSLLIKVLQRLLYHTAFPTGLVILDQAKIGNESRGRITTVVGDHVLAALTGTSIECPTALLQGSTELLADERMLQVLHGSRPYVQCLRLPIDEQASILLLSPQRYDKGLPLAQIFPPILRNLAKAIKLCRQSEELTQRIADDRDLARNELAETLRQSEQGRVFLRNLTDTIPDFVWLKNPDGVYLACNPAFERFFGASEAEIVGKTDYDFVKREIADSFRYHDRVAMEAGKPSINEEWIRYADDGHQALVVVTKTPMYGEDGALIGILGIAHDITELRRSEEALRQSKADLQYANKLAGLGYWRWNLLTDTHSWSEDIYRFYGRDPKLPPASYEEVQRYFTPGSWKKLAVAIDRCISDSKPYVCDAEIVREDGNRRWITVRGAAMQNTAGRITELRGTVQDITERKLLEIENESTRRMLDSIIENIPNMIIMKRASDLRVVLVNKAGEELMGYDRSDLLGKHDTDFLPKKQANAHTTREREILASGSELDISEQTVDTPHRGTRILHTKKIVLRNSQGESEYLLGISDDITERKQAEIALRKSSLYSRSLIEASLDPLVTINPEGKITDVNRATELITGRNRKELVGSDFSDYFSEPLQARAVYRKVFSEGFVTDYPLALRHLSGRVTDVLYNATVYRNEEGTVEGVFAAARDITARKKAEAEIQALNAGLEQKISKRTAQLKRTNEELIAMRDAAEAANRAKSVFLSNMSHELRTPLNAIIGFSQLLAQDTRIPEEQRQNIATINRSGNHLLSLINDVLQISRIEAGRIQMQNESFDLHETIAAIEEMVRLRAKNKGLTLLIEGANTMPRFVKGDANHLRQVLINLLGNAVKYTAQGQVILRSMRQGDHVHFEIADTGCGIAQDDLTQIFNAFYQTAHGIAQGEGTGLGLAISQEFVRMMGGRIDVTSELGQGSVFRFSVPLPEAEAPATQSVKGNVEGLALGHPAVRVLVTEDHADNLHLITTLLQNAGFTVCAAKNGQEAVEAFQSWNPDFIWMDMRMPIMDGYAATKAIRALPGGQDIKIVALTASAFHEDRGAILAAGCDDLLTKPISRDHLFQTMGDLLNLEYRYADEAPTHTNDGNTALDFTEIDKTLCSELYRSAEMLDVEACLEVSDSIRLTHPAMATALDSLIRGFRFEQILAALEAWQTGLSEN